MSGLAAELTTFVTRYEQANNSHDINRVVPMIAADATYQHEVYEIRDLEWIVLTAEYAVCRYRFSWEGVVDGQRRPGQGRGTNVVVKRDGVWQMLHEHLSA